MAQTKTTKKFSNKLEVLIEESGKTLDQLSKETKIPRTSLWKYQNNYAEAPITALSQIADHFDISADYLLGRTPYRKVEASPSNNSLNLPAAAINNLLSLGPLHYLTAVVLISIPSFRDFIDKLERYVYLYGFDVKEASQKLNKEEEEIYELIRVGLLEELINQIKVTAEDVRKEIDINKGEETEYGDDN